ncbi:uncharacterized protein LOC127440271 [Myxocyprinus asiaticus]|uniref:uncharacterized protein LOC127440271 n=1 Tax=Myxocyprinus asiaticus TaxID=70543 RepID=UPI002223EC82|nr:uncharacterized protein LOC127440271 [Myxocyprinus asiaticus]
MNTIRTCVLLLCLFVGSVSSVQRLNNIDDLRNTHYSKREPNHGLKLLFWFAQHVIDIDENYISQMDIEPSRGDYGFHWFENRERILPTLSSEIKGYYSVGNLRYPRATELPAYVRKDHYISPHSPDSNLDRLIVCVNRRDPTRLHSVFITSLIYQLDELDPHLTFEINPALIHQIQCPCNCTSHHYNDYLFSTLTSNRKDINDVQKTLQTAKIIFKEPGLAAFLTSTEYDIKYSYRSFAVRYHCLATSSAKELREPLTQCHITAEIKLEIKTSATGLAKLTWEHIPANVMKEYVFIYVAVCKNTDFSNAHKYHECPKFGVKSSSGSVDTSVYLNFGLQPQLLLYKLVPLVTNGNRGMPTKIKPYRASLQLYTENGKACAQLYIKKTFSDWKNVFSYSWVGFYKNSQEANDQYYTSIYVVKMEKVEKYSTGEYYVYKYQSSLDIAPGVQIRFLLEKKYDDRNVLARTQPWKDTKYPITLQTINDDLHPGLPPELLPHLSNPESFHGPEFDEANGIIPIRILGSDASLQLYANDGKACARLYIKKTFSDWKNVFSYSWVGFYKNSQEANDQYYTYIYVVKMEKMGNDNIMDYDIYQYKSSLDIAPEVQIRFLLDETYDNMLAQTEPWEGANISQITISCFQS